MTLFFGTAVLDAVVEFVADVFELGEAADVGDADQAGVCVETAPESPITVCTRPGSTGIVPFFVVQLHVP